MSNVKWTPQQREDIEAKIDAGWTTPRLAQFYGTTVHSIRALRDDMRLKRQEGFKPRHHPGNDTDDARWGPPGIAAQSAKFADALRARGVRF